MSAWMLLHFLLSVTGTWLALRYALARDLVDRPDERRSHVGTTPRGGGIAIVAALLVAVVALSVRPPGDAKALLLFTGGLLLVAGAGWLDDHRPTSPWLRLATHALAAGLLSLAIYEVSGDPWLAGAAFMAAIVLINVWNFMDGINGLAATQAGWVALVLGATMAGTWASLALALTAACLGFLPFNFPRARIFLGDVGSGALGYVIAALLVMASATRAMPWPLLLLLPSAFLIDAGLTLLVRLLRGERWWTAHAQHAYQVWARGGAGHAKVTVTYLVWTLLAAALMLCLRHVSGLFMLCGVLAWYTSGAFIWWLLRRRTPRQAPSANE
jgi:UDP-N-acetylmuramyl pentapeptide phosphotransferase/UDP-N-acetylglucosamine-1-phosphate transferase